MSEQSDFDVIVVGCGPAGLTASSLLARLGHRVGVIEREQALYTLPRLVNLDAEAARIVQAAGDIDVALRESTEFRGYTFLNSDGQTLIDMDWSGMAVSGFAAHLSMFQPHVDESMDTTVRARGAVVRQGVDVTAVSQDDEGVTVTATPWPGGGTPITTRAKWLVAADGANSTVRGLLGIERKDLHMQGASMNVDMILRHPLQPTPTLRFDAPTVVTAPPRMRIVVPIGTRRIRLSFEVAEDDDRDELLKPESAWRNLREWHNLGPEDVEIYRQVIYDFDSQLASPWRAGRVFLAGDAAHQMSPFIGQGACSGMRDSINLAWRLDLVLRGVSGDGLLDSYELERSKHVSEWIAIATRLGQMSTETDPDKARARDEAFLSGNAPPVTPDPILVDGVLFRGDDGEPVPPAGQLGPQATVASEGRSGRADDVLGWGFALLCDGTDPLAEVTDEHRRFLDAIHAITVPLTQDADTTLVRDVDGAYGRYFTDHGVCAVLVRPDFYIFGAARTPGDVPELLDSLREQLGASVPVS